MKVKNIMFFGFAAAILSAGAASAAATATFSPAVSAPDAAGRQIVSSKSYVDSVATNIAGQLKSVAVTGNYNDLDNKPTVDTTYDSESSNAQSGTAVAGAITQALSDAAAAQVQSDWTETNTSSKAYIANKPNLAPVATSGSYNSLTDTPTVDTTFSASSTNAATSAAIATYINNQNFTTVDSVIPAKPSFCTDANPCALLQDASGYNWYTMATDQSATRQAGTDEKPNPRL